VPEARAHTTDVLVLGAGLAGSCVALALATSGHHVTVLDRAGSAMSGASGNTEAKIHLGYVYALDETMATQRRMLTGALTFAPLLDRWLGPQRWEEIRTPLFEYAVMPDSLLDADDLEARYARIADALEEVRDHVEDVVGGPASYLGRSFEGRVWRTRGSVTGPLLDGRPLSASFATEEAGVNPDRVSDAIRRGLDHAAIDMRPRTEVHEARRDASGFSVAVTDPDGTTAWWRARAVVNCLWDDRLRVDASVGVESPVDTWTYRVKQLVVVRLRPDADPPTVTMVQGPYGDLIRWDESHACLCWYPIARTELRTTAGPRPPRGVSGTVPDPRVAKAMVATMTEMFPALEGSKIVDSRRGVIMAPGATDIDDPASGLHTRPNPAVHEHDGWFTVDTGKYTLAPLLAFVASQRVSAALRGA
jgi:YD repeat-containing protein